MRIAPLAVTLAVLLSVGLLATPAALAQPTQPDTREVLDVYDQNIEQVPDVIRNRFADERVEVTIERSGESDEVYTVVTDGDARVVSFEEGSDDPTLRVKTDETTVREVAQSNDTKSAALEAYRSDRVEVEGVGVTNTVKVEATKVGYRVASSLGLL